MATTYGKGQVKEPNLGDDRLGERGERFENNRKWAESKPLCYSDRLLVRIDKEDGGYIDIMKGALHDPSLIELKEKARKQGLE